MIVYLDIDLGQVVSGLGSKAPASTFETVCADTLDLDIYAVSSGAVVDLGSSAAISFGMAGPGSGAIVLCTAFTREVDDSGKVFFEGQPDFYTEQVLEALGDSASVDCLAEIKYTLADGETLYSLAFPWTLYAPLFPPSGAPPSVILTYPPVETIELLSTRDVPGGHAGLDGDTKLFLAEMPSGVELTAHKNIAGGYAGISPSGYILTSILDPSVPILDSGLLTSDEIPIDGVTIIAVAGKLSAIGPSIGVLAITNDAFTVPTIGSTVSIVVPTGNLAAGLYYTISSGLYILETITDAQHGVFQNVTAVAATVVAFGAAVQWSGPPGATGATGGVGSAGAAGTSFTWRGAWSSGTAYVPNDVVSQAGSTWINILANTGSTPSTDGSVHWDLVAQVGSSTGDMTKSVYDTAVRGYVDRAVLADSATAVLLSGVTGAGTAAAKNIPSSGNANTSQVVYGTDTRLSDSRTPSAHETSHITGGGDVIPAFTSTASGLVPLSGGGTTNFLRADGTFAAPGGGGGGSAVFAQIYSTNNFFTYADATPLPFTTVISDSLGMWSAGSPSILTIPTTGYYLCTASFALLWGGTPGSIQVVIGRNGTASGGLSTHVTGLASGNPIGIISGILGLTAGDTICLFGNSSTGESDGALPSSWISIGAGSSNSRATGPMPSLSVFKIA